MKALINRAIRLGARGGFESYWKLKEVAAVRRSRAGRARQRVETIRDLSKGAVLLFACYPKLPLDEATFAVLRAFSERGAQIVVLANGTIPADHSEPLRSLASVVIERANIGRDFGAYQAGYFFVRDTLGLENVERLIFMNDSLYFFQNRDPGEMMEFLLDPGRAYCGVNENFEYHYHVGSYLFAVSGIVARSAAFVTFWQRYMPYSTRPHSINNGEVQLSRVVMRSGITPDILYSFERVRNDVRAVIDSGMVDSFHLFSLPVRRSILADVGRYKSLDLDGHGIADRDQADRIMEFFQNRNRVHNLWAFFARYAAMPFMKKDIVYRGVFLLTDVLRIIEENQLDSTEAVMRVLRPRGTPASIRGMARLFHNLGLQ